LQTFEAVQTVWREGRATFGAAPRQLVFGQTYEDPRIELRAFPPKSRVFCIAGAGFTAHALAAAGHRVTAVDINAAQLDYARVLNDGDPPRAGVAERVLAAGRRWGALCGWTREKLEAFVNLESCSEQVTYWDRELDTPMWRASADTLLAPWLLRLCYRGPFVAALPPGFGARIRRRLRRGWASHGNRSNPFAALLMLGKPIGCAHAPALPIRFVCADAAEFLEGCAPGSFDAFALSNLGDGSSREYLRRLAVAMKRATSPDAAVVWRSFAEPPSEMIANSIGGGIVNCAAADRSLLWGVVGACRVRDLRDGGLPCCIC
jgi:hypothetical protein